MIVLNGLIDRLECRKRRYRTRQPLPRGFADSRKLDYARQTDTEPSMAPGDLLLYRRRCRRNARQLAQLRGHAETDNHQPNSAQLLLDASHLLLQWLYLHVVAMLHKPNANFVTYNITSTRSTGSLSANKLPLCSWIVTYNTSMSSSSI